MITSETTDSPNEGTSEVYLVGVAPLICPPATPPYSAGRTIWTSAMEASLMTEIWFWPT
jgi:hypothetical protein